MSQSCGYYTVEFKYLESSKMFRPISIVLFTVIAAATSNGSVFPHFSGNPFERYSISTDGINATFMPYGARLTNLFVNDKVGVPRDVVSK
jgi:aldose 1-epimerase